MKVSWSPRAQSDVDSLFEYVSIDSLAAALAILQELRRQIAQLSDHPQMGRPGRVRGTRELVINRTPYIVAYRVGRAAIVVLAVLHGAQQWPEKLGS